MKKVDLIVLFCGSCLHSNLSKLYYDLLEANVLFLAWGVSPIQYNSDDVSFARLILNRSNTVGIITRDAIIANKIGYHDKFISGIDGGYWMGETYKIPKKDIPYSIINLEKNNQIDIKKTITLN